MPGHQEDLRSLHTPGLAVQWQAGSDGQEHQVPIQTVTFDPCRLDTIEDEIRERIARGRSLDGIIAALLHENEADLARRMAVELSFARRETVVALLAAMFEAANWQMAGYAIAFAANLETTLGISQPAVARQFGVKKQNINQLVKHYRRKLDLPISLPNTRSPEARAKMSARNHRHGGK